jgi:hypothetical protein
MQARDRQRNREAKKARRARAHKSFVRARNADKIGKKTKGSLIRRGLAPVNVSAHPTTRTNRSQVVYGEGGVDVHIARREQSPVDGAKTLGELKALAKQHGVKGYSKYKKADIETLRASVREAVNGG